MSLMTWGIEAAERGWVPDSLIRSQIRRLCSQRAGQGGRGHAEDNRKSLQDFVQQLRHSPIALVPDKANQQHYEVPAEFFQYVLGPHRKYSCCLWTDTTGSLEAAESAALAETCQRAELRDGQNILELGCGWGSLTLWMAEHYPRSQITAVSNSTSQRIAVCKLARERGFNNVTVITADMNNFQTHQQFDRVVSVEMFEHMRNYEQLLARIAGWLKPDGRLFVHIFSHRELAYPFECDGDNDWMARHFFTGGIMPSEGLLHHFQRDLSLVDQWRWSGQHYEKTSNAWLANLDARRSQVLPILRNVYGERMAVRWFHRWRLFFLACAELFAYGQGDEWGVSHYLFEPRG